MRLIENVPRQELEMNDDEYLHQVNRHIAESLGLSIADAHDAVVRLFRDGLLVLPSVIEAMQRRARAGGAADATRNFSSSLPAEMKKVQRAAWDEGAVAGMAREDGQMPDNPYAEEMT